MIKLQKNKVIIISPDIIGEKMAGPGIRYWNFARVLSDTMDVILYTPNYCSLESNFLIRKFNKDDIIKESLDTSTIIVQGLTLWNYPFLKSLQKPIVVDLYDPFIFENLELFNEDKQMYRTSLSILIDQLLLGDYFICASEKQKDFWLGMLASINRINPMEYSKDKSLNNLIDVVPFGLNATPPKKTKSVLKGVVEGITEKDNVLLWGGGIWDWLDPLTAIKGMKEITQSRDDVKLFFMGIEPPNASLILMKNVQRTIQLSNELDLTNKYVFFNSWVDYEERQNYLLESDIGVNLHYDHIETRFAYRTRILDYIWSDLPIVTTMGDSLSELVFQNDIGLVIQPENSSDFSFAVQSVLNEKTSKANNFKMLRETMTWEKCLQPLVIFCEKPNISLGKNDSLVVKGLIRSKIHYNLIKASSYIRNGRFKELILKIMR